MTNKTKIIIGSLIGVILILAAILFTQKGKVDEKLSIEVAEKLKDISKDLDFDLNFEKVNVNSTGPYVELLDVKIKDNEEEISFDKLKIGTSFDEILKIFNEKELTNIESMYLEMENMVVNNSKMGLKHTLFSDAKFEYSGSIDQKSFERMKERMVIPDSDQKISINISDFSLPTEIWDEFYREMDLGVDDFYANASMNQDPADINFEMELLSDEKIIKIITDSENNGQFTGSSEFEMEMSFEGDKFDEIEPKSMEIDGNFDVDMKGFTTEIEQGLDIEMNDVTGSISGSFDIDENMSEEEIIREMSGGIKFKVDDLSIILPYQAMAGMPPGLLENNKLEINKMSFNMDLKDGDFFGDFDYDSSIGKIKSNFDFGINMRNPDNSYINNFEVFISNLPDELEELIGIYEMGAGDLPRKGNSIYLNIYGSLDNPKIEGVDLY